MMRVMWALMGVLVMLPGCATQQPSTFDVAPGAYAAAFEAAKEALRETGFELDRVDARAGVITTLAKATSGFATPWTGVESTFEQSWEGMLNHDLRTARVTFLASENRDGGAAGGTPGEGASSQGSAIETPPKGAGPAEQAVTTAPEISLTPVDLREASVPMVGRVEVTVRRIYRPNLRPSETSVRLTSIATNPIASPETTRAARAAKIGEDEWLAGRVASLIIADIAIQK